MYGERADIALALIVSLPIWLLAALVVRMLWRAATSPRPLDTGDTGPTTAPDADGGDGGGGD